MQIEIHVVIAREGILERDLVLPAQNIVTWNTLISGYVEHGNGDEALKLYERMQLEGVRNVIIFT